MPIMKLLDDKNNTVWIPHPHNVFEIEDIQGGCRIWLHPGSNESLPVKGQTARAVKRSIQENVEVPIYFLKTHYVATEKRTVYLNTEYLMFVEASEKNNEPVALLHFEGTPTPFTVEHDPTEVALQLRRIAKRFDQDQELCCSPPPEPEEE